MNYLYKVGDIVKWTPTYITNTNYVVKILNVDPEYRYEVLISSDQEYEVGKIFTYKASAEHFERNYSIDYKTMFDQDLKDLLK